MIRSTIQFVATSLVLMAIGANPAHAAIISSPGDPLLAGATIETFDGAPLGSFSNLALAGVTVSASSSAFINSDGNGAYVPPNPPGDQHILVSSVLLTFTFDSPVGAFGIQIGATNTPQTLTAYDTNGMAIGSLVIPDQVSTQPFPYTGFYGLGNLSSNIAYFTVTNTFDAVVYDDLYFANAAAVPEPASLAVWGVAMAGLAVGGARRRRWKRSTI